MEKENSKKMKLTFYGGAGTVSGSNFMLEDEDMKILIDAGLENGLIKKENGMYFVYDPSSVDVLLVTHSHLGNIGMIPILIKEGFKGKIYSTPETKSLSELIFLDSLSVLNPNRDKKDLFDEEDVKKIMSLWDTYPYYKKFGIGGDLKVEFKNAGHFLGSSIIEIIHNDKKVVFTGCLGNSPHPLLKNVDPVNDADYLIIESVYGDKVHESKEERRELFEDAIEETVNRGGALLIPTFSFERTQDILFEIHKLTQDGKIPSVPVFIDSPFSEKVIEIYNNSYINFNKEAMEMMFGKMGIFNFPLLKFINTDKESEEIYNTPNPKVIIGGAGMSSGKRILFHQKKYISDPNSTVLFVEYQPAGSIGRQLQEGAETVKIDNEDTPVRAQIETIRGYSSHGDFNALFDFVSETRRKVKKVFVVNGEPKVSMYFTQKIRDYLGVHTAFPQKNESYMIEL